MCVFLGERRRRRKGTKTYKGTVRVNAGVSEQDSETEVKWKASTDLNSIEYDSNGTFSSTDETKTLLTSPISESQA